MKKTTDYVIDREGNAVAGAEVYVKNQADDTLADLFSDNGSTAKTNPLTTDNDGEFSFYVADGTYKLQVYIEGEQQQEITNFQVFDAEDNEIKALRSVTSAADKLFYFTGSGTGAATDFTAFGRSLVDDADASTARTTLGLVIGTNVQAYDALLGSIAGLTFGADNFIYGTGADTAAAGTITAFGRSLVDDGDAATARTTLGLGTMATETATDYMPKSGGTFTGDIVVPAEAYGVGWNGSNEAPTKNDVYDKIEALGSGGDPELTEYTTTDPTPPASGLTLLARKSPGNAVPATVDPDGFERELQRAIADGDVRILRASNGANGVAGFGFNGTGTQTGGSSVSCNATSFVGRFSRKRQATSSSAGNSASIHTGAATVGDCSRGSVAGAGGFRWSMRWTISGAVANGRGFFGLAPPAAIGNVEPSSLTNIFGFGFDAGETNFSLMHNDEAGSATKVDLGADYPTNVNNTYIYRAEFSAEPNGSEIHYCLKRYSATGLDFETRGTINADMPTNTTMLSAQMWINNGATASSTSFEWLDFVYEDTGLIR